MSGAPQDGTLRRDVALAEKVAALERPGTYPEAPRRVETVETHMSWVFLTDTHAYKLKKPVRTQFLDFSTVERRRLDGEDELRLNRRLAPDVYLGLVALTRTSAGRLVLEGDGQTVDWLVKMQRLAGEQMLDHVIAHGAPTAEQLRALGRVLAQFYSAQAPVPMSPQAYRARLGEDIIATRDVLLQPDYGLPAARVRAHGAAMLAFIEANRASFDARVDARRIVEGHGDLRPEHVCLSEPPVIIDCLEFNRDLRILDAVDELAFLALECERLGAPDIGAAVIDTYVAESGDRAPPPLIDFYRAYRAYVRAKVAVWHIDDHALDDHAKWIARAEHYIDLAESHIGALSGAEQS